MKMSGLTTKTSRFRGLTMGKLDMTTVEFNNDAGEAKLVER